MCTVAMMDGKIGADKFGKLEKVTKINYKLMSGCATVRSVIDCFVFREKRRAFRKNNRFDASARQLKSCMHI